MAKLFDRHTMVNASVAGWAAVMSRHPELAGEPILADWARAGRPLVVRRPCCSDADGLIPVGLPLPPNHGKRRIALLLAPRDIIRSAPPPYLADAAPAAPAQWRETIDLLLELLPDTRTFGSLAWQLLTGLAYLSDASDLDLLWPLSSARPAASLPLDIARIANRAPMRLDGEIVGSIGGVQWRELTGADQDEVLVKGPAGVHSTTRAAFLAGGLS